ncbi:MAG TPA: MASE1 domain-containing protein, partial [Steroidobacteraceae bacterium]|nr:MASE1 domain-containing protein [Steroidobacteraceae bacterium]
MNVSLPAAGAATTAASEGHQLLIEEGEVLVTAVFFVIALASVCATGSSAVGTSLFWPANAIAAALLVRLRSIHWVRSSVSLFLAGVMANALGDNESLQAAMLMSFGDVLEILVAVYLLRSPLRMPFPEITLPDGARLLILLGLIIPAAGTLPGAMAAHLAYGVPLRTAAMTWYVSTVSGAVLCAPSLYLCSSQKLRRLFARATLRRNVAIAVACLIFAYVAIRFLRYPLMWMGLPLLIGSFWIGAFGVALLCELLGIFIVTLWWLGVRPPGMIISLHEPGVLATLPFLALASLNLWPVLVGLAADDRERATRAVRANEERFRQSLRHSPLGVLIRALDGRLLLANDAFLKMLGCSREELESLGSDQIVHPDDLEAC